MHAKARGQNQSPRLKDFQRSQLHPAPHSTHKGLGSHNPGMMVTVKLHYRARIERGTVHQRGLEEVNQTTPTTSPARPPQFRAGALTGHYEARNATYGSGRRALQICSLLQRVIARGYDWFAIKGLGMGQKRAQHNGTDHLKRTS